MSEIDLSKKKKSFNPQMHFCPIGTPIPSPLMWTFSSANLSTTGCRRPRSHLAVFPLPVVLLAHPVCGISVLMHEEHKNVQEEERAVPAREQA